MPEVRKTVVRKEKAYVEVPQYEEKEEIPRYEEEETTRFEREVIHYQEEVRHYEEVSHYEEEAPQYEEEEVPQYEEEEVPQYEEEEAPQYEEEEVIHYEEEAAYYGEEVAEYEEEEPQVPQYEEKAPLPARGIPNFRVCVRKSSIFSFCENTKLCFKMLQCAWQSAFLKMVIDYYIVQKTWDSCISTLYYYLHKFKCSMSYMFIPLSCEFCITHYKNLTELNFILIGGPILLSDCAWNT